MFTLGGVGEGCIGTLCSSFANIMWVPLGNKKQGYKNNYVTVWKELLLLNEDLIKEQYLPTRLWLQLYFTADSIPRLINAEIEMHHQANTTNNCCQKNPPMDAKISSQKLEEQKSMHHFKVYLQDTYWL